MKRVHDLKPKHTSKPIIQQGKRSASFVKAFYQNIKKTL